MNDLTKLSAYDLVDLLAEAIESSNAPGYNVKGVLCELFGRYGVKPEPPLTTTYGKLKPQ